MSKFPGLNLKKAREKDNDADHLGKPFEGKMVSQQPPLNAGPP